MSVDLSKYSNPTFSHGKSIVVRFLWMFVSSWLINTWVPFPSNFKVFVLRLFGAKIGEGLVIRSHVRIKQPWRLSIGNHVWIGESVWIDNLVQVNIDSNVCISQGAFLITGNHDYNSSTFDLITGEIHLGDGVWVGAKSMVGPGVRCMPNSVLSAGSTTFNDLEASQIYQGNPATVKRKRNIRRCSTH